MKMVFMPLPAIEIDQKDFLLRFIEQYSFFECDNYRAKLIV